MSKRQKNGYRNRKLDHAVKDLRQRSLYECPETLIEECMALLDEANKCFRQPIIEIAESLCSRACSSMRDIEESQQSSQANKEKQKSRLVIEISLWQELIETRKTLCSVLQTDSNENSTLKSFSKQLENIQRQLSSATGQKEVARLESSLKLEVRRWRNGLPIYSQKNFIKATVQDNDVTILVAETGSGKSTQLPQYLLETQLAQTGLIVCTQPRKIAANRLAEHVDTELFQENTVTWQASLAESGKIIPQKTKLLYVTDSFLLRQFSEDPQLRKYSCVIVDEAHERTLNSDVLLAMLKRCLQLRNELKLVITSATIEPKLFLDYFSDYRCQVIQVPGKVFPVETKYISDNSPADSIEETYIQMAVDQVIKICNDSNAQGHILVFLVSPYETEKANRLLESYNLIKIEIHQLHGQISGEDQKAACEETSSKGFRKVILATNIAETSLTIPGVRHVIDCGLAKEAQYDPKNGATKLVVTSISKSSADQRKGRAGRTAPGVCYRLYEEYKYDCMTPFSTPEIKRVNLGQVILFLKKIGVQDPLTFDFLENPDSDSLQKSLKQLHNLKALQPNGEMTKLGLAIQHLSLDPRYGKLIIQGKDNGLGLKVIAIVGTMTAGRLFYRANDKQFADQKKLKFCDETGDITDCTGDLFTNLRLFTEWYALPRGKRTSWCIENAANGKSLRAVEIFIKEQCSLLKRMPQSFQNGTTLHSQNDRDLCQPLTSEERKTICRLMLSCFQENWAFFSGHPRGGYYSTHLDRYVALHPSSSLHLCAQNPAWILFEYPLETCRHYVHNIISIPNETWIPAHQDEIEMAKFARLQSRDLTKLVGPYICNKIKQQRYSLTKLMSGDTGEPVIISCRKDQNYGSEVHAAPDQINMVMEKLERFIRKEKDILKHSVSEFPLFRHVNAFEEHDCRRDEFIRLCKFNIQIALETLDL